MREAAPILVAGLDHSGKTALRAALDRHPSIRLIRHVELFTRLRGWFAQGQAGRRRVVDALTSGRAARLELDRERLTAAAADVVFGSVACEIGRQVCARAGTSRWGAQEALLELQAAQVFRDLPDARVIQLVRDPRVRIADMRQRGALGRGGVAAETAAWIASARAAAAAAERWPEAWCVLRYESLLQEPETTLRAVCAVIGEPFVPEMLVGLPSAGHVEPLSAREVAFVQLHAGREMLALGYALEPGTPSPDILPRRLADASRWQLGQWSWRRRARRLDTSLAVE